MKKKIIKNFYVILICLLILIGISFAFFSANFIGHREHAIDIKGLVFRYTEASQGITLTNPDLLKDSDGKTQNTYFDFNVYIANNNDYAMTYNIYLKELVGNTLSTNYVKVYLTDQGENQIVPVSTISALKIYPNDSDSYILYTDTIAPNQDTKNNTKYYRLRLWLSDNYDDGSNSTTVDNKQTVTIVDKTFAFKVNVDNLTIVEDRTIPTITSVTSSNEVTATKKAITVVANDNIGVRGYIIKNSNEVPSLNDNWAITNATSWTSDSIYSNGTYYVFVRDGNNNISSATSTTVANVNITKPICTWSGPNNVNIKKGETATFVLTCVDTDTNPFIDSLVTTSDIIISNINAVNVSEPVKAVLANNAGYTYTFTLTGIANGNVTLTAKKDIVTDANGYKNDVSSKSNVLNVSILKTLEDVIKINNGNSATNNTSVTLNLNVPTATKVCFSLSDNMDTDCSLSGSNYVPYEQSKSYTLASSEGEKTVYAYFDTSSGIVIGNDSIILDRIKPTCNITSSNPDIWTNAKTLTINGTDTNSGIAVNGYSFNNNTYSTVNIKDVTSNGTYTYYVKDNASNVGSCSITVNKIDAVAPVISSASYGRTTNQKTTISYAATDTISGLNAYLITNSSTPPLANDIGWISNSSNNFTTAAIYSDGTYYVYTKDNVGNISSGYEVVVGNLVTPTCQITVNPEIASSTKVLTVTSSNPYIIANGYSWVSATEGFSNNNTKIVNSNGIYQAYVKDDNNNIGTCSVTIINIDSISPTIETFYVGGSSNPEYATSATSSIYLTYNDTDVVSYCIAETNSSTACTWINGTSSPITEIYTFNNTNGTKTLYAYLKDNVGNISEAKSDSIILDMASPIITNFVHAGNGVINVTATDATNNLASICINTSATGEGCNYVSYTSGDYQTTITSDGTYYAHVKDSAGNVTHSTGLTISGLAVAQYRTMTYSNCATGSNTCSGGYVNGAYDSCLTGSNTCSGGYVTGSCTTEDKICRSGGYYNYSASGCGEVFSGSNSLSQCQMTCSSCTSSSTWVPYSDCYCASGTSSGTYTCSVCSQVWDSCATGSNTCSGGYEQVWNSCATGSNTCSSGYIYGTWSTTVLTSNCEKRVCSLNTDGSVNISSCTTCSSCTVGTSNSCS